jgi:extradiol dioxygenase family protein
MFMNAAGITAALPAQDLDRAKNFYVEKVGLQAGERPASRGQQGSRRLLI